MRWGGRSFAYLLDVVVVVGMLLLLVSQCVCVFYFNCGVAQSTQFSKFNSHVLRRSSLCSIFATNHLRYSHPSVSKSSSKATVPSPLRCQPLYLLYSRSILCSYRSTHTHTRIGLCRQRDRQKQKKNNTVAERRRRHCKTERANRQRVEVALTQCAGSHDCCMCFVTNLKLF